MFPEVEPPGGNNGERKVWRRAGRLGDAEAASVRDNRAEQFGITEARSRRSRSAVSAASGSRILSLQAALLVFLARATWARIVASNLGGPFCFQRGQSRPVQAFDAGAKDGLGCEPALGHGADKRATGLIS